MRVIRACRELGIETVVGYSTADKNSLMVEHADIAVHIGPSPAKLSYLCVPNLVEAARGAGADAMHPGYGFLSEDPYIAAICAEADLKFIGPRPEVMAAITDKAVVRDLVRRAGLPVLNGSAAAVSTLEEARRVASSIGYPLVIKAALGGGGRGITVVDAAEELPDAFISTRTTARAVFRDPSVYLERYVPRARHVEVQVMGDEFGHVVHLGERDCSVQRRHQKLIEESPAPHLDAVTRQRLGEAAVAGATALGFTGAGTMEFLLDENGEFYFIEINGRLQVEHPVTEMVTGIDLVQTQIRVAAGEPLPFAQRDVRTSGQAIECRINAEDPDAGFRPAPGKIEQFVLPGGPWVRIDTGYRAGDQVPRHYDSLIAKLIVWAPDRAGAIARGGRALDELCIDGPGLRTTAAFLRRTFDHPEFRAGTHSTHLVDQMTVAMSGY